ncbi:MAG: helix-turn-helix transcriptional regulator [Solirubrobacteraceae bacterium]
MASPEHSPIGEHHASRRRRRLQDPAYLEAARQHTAYEALARMVIRFRMDRDLSQGQLAELVGTSNSAISRLESGAHRPSVETLQKLAHAFKRQLVIGFADPTDEVIDEPLEATIADRHADLVALP